jgi:hypothetical protein
VALSIFAPKLLSWHIYTYYLYYIIYILLLVFSFVAAQQRVQRTAQDREEKLAVVNLP